MTRPCSQACPLSHHLPSPHVLSVYTSPRVPGCIVSAVPSARIAPLPHSFVTWQTLTHPSKPAPKLAAGWSPLYLCLHPRVRQGLAEGLPSYCPHHTDVLYHTVSAPMSTVIQAPQRQYKPQTLVTSGSQVPSTAPSQMGLLERVC